MDDHVVEAAAYLDALADLTRSLSHETRAQLGNLTLHVGLLGELLNRAGPPDGAIREQWERNAGRIEADVKRIVGAVERLLGLMRRARDTETSFDLRLALIEVESLIAPYLQERRLKWTMVLPREPVSVRGRRDLVERTLIVALASAARAVASGGEVGLRPADGAPPGVVVIESGRGHGAVDSIEIRLPVAAVTEP